MKTKKILIGLLVVISAGLIAVSLYSKSQIGDGYISSDNLSYSTENRDTRKTNAFLTSLQSEAGQIDFTYAAEQTVHAVVHVRTKSVVQSRQSSNPLYEWFYGSPYDRGQESRREVSGFGSGVIITTDGYIITNNHVIDRADAIEVKLNDNRLFDAVVVGTDPTTDLAVLKIDADNLDYVEYGDSDNLKLGEWVLAVGNPFNLTSSVTAGIVSAKGRNLGLLDDDYRIESFIQTDAALNPGNSGGALVDSRGLLVGISTAIYSYSGNYAGASFAVPVSIVKKVVEDLIEYGEVQRALLGVTITDVTPEDAKELDLPNVRGAKIGEISPNGAAANSDLKANDVIVRVNNKVVSSSAELQEQIGRYRPGEQVTIVYLRKGKEYSTQVTLKNISGNTDIVKAGVGSDIILGARIEQLTQDEKNNYRISNGVKIVSIENGKLKEIGMTEGTIIVSINNKRINKVSDAKEALGEDEALKSIEGLQPSGVYFNYRLSR